MRAGLVAILALVSMPVHAEDAPPPEIRDFDIATVASLGQAMYAQDQLAWVATDTLIAERGDTVFIDDALRGWVVFHDGEHDVVRFIGEGPNGLAAVHDVVFTAGQNPQLQAPASPILSPDDLAQHAARRLAVNTSENTCTNNTNTIALREPGSDRWLVWVIAATTENDVMIVGGHYRLTISADGLQVIAADKLSRACLNMATGGVDGLQDGDAALVTHTVSPRPVETHVFLSLNYQRVFFVGTNDATSWKIDDTSITTTDEGDPGVDGNAARFIAGNNENCSFMTENAATPGETAIIGEGQARVISETERGTFVPPQLEDGESLVAVICTRHDIVPSPNDYKVLAAGYPLYILEPDTDRTTVLELDMGQVKFRQLQGEGFTQEEQTRIVSRLSVMQEQLRTVP